VSVPREELEAAVEARRELGRERDPEVIEAFLDRIDRELDRRIDERVAARRAGGSHGGGSAYVVTLVSLGVSIPLIAIAGGTAGVAGVFVVCAALVIVNALAWRS
jgi:Flp pilus assembly protein TadB